MDGLQNDLSVDAETVVINTNSRLCDGREAYRRVADSLGPLSSQKGLQLFKKVDSTLRGNVGAEIDALMDSGRFTVACLAPATPRNGRSVENGVCYVNGKPLDQTEMAADPFTPVCSAKVREILAAQSSRNVGALPLGTIRGEQAKALVEVQALIAGGTEILIADSTTTEDLQAVARIFAELGDSVLYVGSAGLFHAMAQGAAVRSSYVANPEAKALFVVGSLMGTTAEQIDLLKSRRGVASFTLGKAGTPEEVVQLVDRTASGIHEAFLDGPLVSLETDRVFAGTPTDGDAIGRTIGQTVGAALEYGGVDALVVTGGDTALQVLTALGVRQLRLIAEALPGVPVANIELKDGSSIVFISKAGSYGDADAFCQVTDYLTGSQYGRSYS